MCLQLLQVSLELDLTTSWSRIVGTGGFIRDDALIQRAERKAAYIRQSTTEKQTIKRACTRCCYVW